MVVLESGEAWAFGANKSGQLGSGSVKNKPKEDDVALTPVKCVVEGVASVAAGQDFTAWVTKTGELLTAGNPQYGVLGHGTDHEFNCKDGAVKLAYQPQPVPAVVQAFAKTGTKVSKVAAGQAHFVAVDGVGKVYTWGNGGYGRLGHKEQKDEWLPKQVLIQGGDRNLCPPDCVVAAGSTSSFVSAAQGQLYFWGKTKVNGDNAMYPRPFMELSGWLPLSFCAGATTFACVTESSTITWGHAAHGELGYGPEGKKSSANPEKVGRLEGMRVLTASAGVGHMLLLAAPGEQLAKLPVWTPPADAPEAAAAAGDGKKRKGEAAGEGAKGGAGKKR